MEAARDPSDLPERIRMHRFTVACEKLRPLGVAYVLGHFGNSLDLADAEDVVAEVIIRFHRLAVAGRPPERLRPAFFTSVKNAAYDLLRYRGIRPTAPLEAAADKATGGPTPEEHAESRDNVVRLREAMARMGPGYREVIVLRFGLDLTVPQIAEHLQISLAAAKKRVLRSTGQIRDRMEAIDGREFCPEMRELARRSVLDGEIAGLPEEADGAAIRAHLEHCGPCRSFLTALRSDLHELGGGVLLGALGGGRLGLLGHLSSAFHGVVHGARAAAARIRLASYRATGALPAEGSGAAGLFAGTGQKLAAVCTAGAAGAATCLASGIVGPGLGVGAGHPVDPHPIPPAAQIRKAPTPVHRPVVSYSAPREEVEGTENEEIVAPAPQPRGRAVAATKQPKPKPQPTQHAEPKPTTPAQTAQAEFGFEGEASAEPTPSPSTDAAPVTQSRTVEATTPVTNSSPEASKTSGSSGSTGKEEFGFGG